LVDADFGAGAAADVRAERALRNDTATCHQYGVERAPTGERRVKSSARQRGW
jgi:hypothetical protein